MDRKALFDEIVKMCGFSSMMGPGTVKRALNDGGVDVDTATVDDYRKALPKLQARLEVYVAAPEAANRARKIAKFLDGVDGISPGASSAKTDDWADDNTEFGRRKFGRSIQILKEVREQLRKHLPPEEGATADDARTADRTDGPTATSLSIRKPKVD